MVTHMCRILAYLGKPILIKELLLEPDHSLIKQTFEPFFMTGILNLAGFGMASWDDSMQDASAPLLFRTTNLPFFDKNLASLSGQIKTRCLLAHIRGAEYTHRQSIELENTHPFVFENSTLAIAHNGELEGYKCIKTDLYKLIKPEIAQNIHGDTDTELVYGILMSLLENPYGKIEVDELVACTEKLLTLLMDVRTKNKSRYISPLNLFMTNGEYIVITHYCFDYGFLSPKQDTTYLEDFGCLWYTYGHEYGFFDGEYKMKKGDQVESFMFSSEPLTKKISTWTQVPEYSLMIVKQGDKGLEVATKNIDL